VNRLALISREKDLARALSLSQTPPVKAKKPDQVEDNPVCDNRRRRRDWLRMVRSPRKVQNRTRAHHVSFRRRKLTGCRHSVAAKNSRRVPSL